MTRFFPINRHGDKGRRPRFPSHRICLPATRCDIAPQRVIRPRLVSLFMRLSPNRLVSFFTLFAVLSTLSQAAASAQPTFMVGTSSTDTYPYYQQIPFNTVLVGKTVAMPIVVSGSGPITYSVTSNTPAILPVIKTGYPVMNIVVSFSGTTQVSGTVNTIHTFTGGASDGGNPYAGLFEFDDIAGTLYGTTSSGTAVSGSFGAAFDLSGTTTTTLHTFTDGTDGGNSRAALTAGTDGNLYGTTESGGANGDGTVFQLTVTGTLNTIHAFTSGTDGGNPYAALVEGADGNLYGTTSAGGAGFGTIFRISTSGSFQTLYTFTGGSDGGAPYAPLIAGTDGNFYGTTSGGGAGGKGTIFEITPGGAFSSLYSFTGADDGATPYAALVQAGNGNFYGTTESGGANGEGTVFEFVPGSSPTTVHAFSALSSGSNADGANPYAALVSSTDGSFYGTAEAGGANGDGAVFRIPPGGGFTTVYSFTGGGDGANPYAPLLLAGDGNLYGTTESGGAGGFGTAFQVAVTTSPAFSGTMTFALLRDMAPVAASYIAGFAQAGYYNNLDFFRIANLANEGDPTAFIAQGGDPTETGTGTPGFAFNNEYSPSLIFYGQGQLAMANAGISQSTFLGSNGAQFFISQSTNRGLDYGYTIFGQMLTGFDVMQEVMNVPVGGSEGQTPTTPVVMNSVTVTEDHNDAILFLTPRERCPARRPSRSAPPIPRATRLSFPPEPAPPA